MPQQDVGITIGYGNASVPSVWIASIVVAAAALLACGSGLWHRTAEFPEAQSGPWVIPLVDPLIENRLIVEGAPYSQAGRPYRGRFVLDSGASTSTLAPGQARQLGLEIVTRSNVTLIDASGRRYRWRGALVPRADLGPLSVRQMPAAIARGGLIGNCVLANRPWEVDWDRGTLTVGAASWNAEERATNIRLLPMRGGTSQVSVRLNHHDVLLVLDTGATHTSIDRQHLAELNLERIGLPREVRFATVRGEERISHIYRSDSLELGDFSLRGTRLFPLREYQQDGWLGGDVIGLLGLDTLSGFRVRVEPGSEMQLSPRRTILAHVRERISRWSWVQNCEDAPGCVTASVRSGESDESSSTDDDSLELTVRFERPYEEASFLFGCVVGDDLAANVPLMKFAVPRAAAGQAFTRRWEGDKSDRLSEYSRGLLACDRIALVDVGPLPLGGEIEQPRVSLHRPNFDVTELAALRAQHNR